MEKARGGGDTKNEVLPCKMLTDSHRTALSFRKGETLKPLPSALDTVNLVGSSP